MARARREVTIKDVAREAGVGLATVSRVINKQGDVNDACREKVLAVIDRLGYRPDLLARSMRAGHSQTLALIVRDFRGTTLSQLADSVQNEVDRVGFSLFVASSYHDPVRELAMLQRFKARRVDGLIVATSSETDPVLRTELVRPGPPVVLFDRATPETLDVVQADHASGTGAAVTHLVALGHRRISLITGEPDVFPTRERVRGWREALVQAGLEAEARLCRVGSFAVEFGREQTRELLCDPRPPTAIIAGGTALLPGVMHAAQELGRRIPDDVSLIGGADANLARFATPPVTVLSWDHDAMARTAARFIVSRLQDPSIEPRRRLFPVTLVVRGSTAMPYRVQ